MSCACLLSSHSYSSYTVCCIFLFKQISGAPRTPSGTLGTVVTDLLLPLKGSYLKKGGHMEALAEGATSGDVPSDRGGPRVDHLRTDLVPPSHRLKRRPNGTSLRPSDVRWSRALNERLAIWDFGWKPNVLSLVPKIQMFYRN